MTIIIPQELELSVLSLVRDGRFASEQEVVAEALRAFLPRQEATVAEANVTASDDELQRRLFAAGLLSEIKPPIQDLEPYRNRRAIQVDGEPLSETVIRERR